MKRVSLFIQKSLITLTSLFVWTMAIRLLIHILMNDVTLTVSSVISYSIVCLFIGFVMVVSGSLLIEILKSKEL